MPDATPPLPPIPPVTKIDEVVEAIQSIVDWSISTSSRLGYFAALYKRITIAVRTALHKGASRTPSGWKGSTLRLPSAISMRLMGTFIQTGSRNRLARGK